MKRFPISRARFVVWLREHQDQRFKQESPCDCALACATGKDIDPIDALGPNEFAHEQLPAWAREVSRFQNRLTGLTGREILTAMGATV